MKKVLFALTPAQKTANGSAIYTEFVFKKAVEDDRLFDVYFNPEIEDNKALIEFIPQKISSHKCSNLEELKILIEKEKYDTIFFGSEQDTNVQLPEFVSPIIVIHDLRFIEVPNDKTRYLYRENLFSRCKQFIISILIPRYNSFLQKKRLSNFINNSKLQIVTVSNHTKYSILLNYPHLDDKQIHVLYCPYPDLNTKSKIEYDLRLLKKNNLISKEYFLIISAGRWFKNAYRAIEAFDSLASKKLLGNKKVLVLGAHDAAKIKKVKNKDAFIFEGYIEDKFLQCVLQNAYGLVYPSLQEGFGIPPLEAMQFGVPVLAAATSAIYEICRDGAYYFNPYNIMEIENRILQLLRDNNFYDIRCEEGIRRANEIALRQKHDLKELIDLIFK